MNEAVQTPLMRQYRQVKAKYPETILLFRMGDFYETFDEDAVIASKALGITLTRRGNGAAGEVPLAGFPYHALESYMPKLLRAGYRVAVCEQLEDPKFAKGIVKRDVIEVATPGIAFSENVLDRKQNNYLACIALPGAAARGDDIVGFSFIDVSTGEFHTCELPLNKLSEQLDTLQPAELLLQKRDLESLKNLLTHRQRILITKMDDWIFHYDYAYELLAGHFKTQTLKGFGLEEMQLGVVAAGSILNYLQETQKANLQHIKRIVPYDLGSVMALDESTKRNLEITSSLGASKFGSEGTLFSILDRTLTPMGGRMLKRWISQPLKHVDPINERLDAVASLVNHERERSKLREALQPIGDLERLTARIATGRATPREVNQLKYSLEAIPVLQTLLGGAGAPVLETLQSRLTDQQEVVQRIDATLNPDAPMSIGDGNVIRQGFHAELDELRTLASSGKDWIARLQREERDRTGITSLKIGYNNVFGYYIEITNAHKDKAPPDYIRKQTLTNAERYITPQLKEYEEKILNAEEKISSLEKQLFDELRQFIGGNAAAIQHNARMIGALDSFASLAQVAVENNYVRPTIDDSTVLEIMNGRHPVLEKLLPPGERYTPNNTILAAEKDQVHIITGPNMSGKSSYLRQVGLIVLLAQAGSFVPAEAARIGVVDKIYTRVGASDNITSGESTFLVEMHEAAHIVNTATSHSLILLDEVGRGTSTFDGISIAWALTEYLHQRIGARTLFATHYHELNELAELYPRIVNYKVDVREYGDKVIFLHKVLRGFADHSYGIQVAQMAGLPEEVTERAKHILRNLEASELTLLEQAREPAAHADNTPSPSPKSRRVRIEAEPSLNVQMSLFELKNSALDRELSGIDLDRITPMQAMNLLAEIKQKIEKSPPSTQKQ
jgi:DNA mismatch repair protein MutS